MSEMRPATRIEASLVIGFCVGLLSGVAIGFLITWIDAITEQAPRTAFVGLIIQGSDNIIPLRA
jgi:hypothetical protein